MKLCSIINVWADCVELLPFCIENHLQFCDGVIVVTSSRSNHGVTSVGMSEFIENYPLDPRVVFEQCEPIKGLKAKTNETAKRNYGLHKAVHSGFTHILMADADEFWCADAMRQLKIEFDFKEDLNGFVHPLKVFIKSPTLWCRDHTLVPGIHKLDKGLVCGNFRDYPYTYDTGDHAHIDPTRRFNITKGIEYNAVPMLHMSYVRKNIDLKIDNSSANLRNSRQVIYDELRDAKPGYVSRLYHQPLQSCENYFNLPIW